jgi:transposase
MAMGYVEGQDRHQFMLLPDSIEDLVGEDNPVRVVDAFVDGLNLEKLGFSKNKPADTGRPAYNPRDLLKLYIYGYFNKIRSSRKLMKECQRNIELFYLLRRLTPDFRTIADFRKDNAAALKGVFREFVGICLSLNLYQKELLAIDGSKFRAVNSKANSYNQETLVKKLARIEENIQRYFAEMDELDKAEPDEKKVSKAEIQAKIKALEERRSTYQDYQRQLKNTGESQILTTDPEARVMQSKDGYHCCYNVQTAVDNGSHLIADYAVTNNCTDQGLLEKVADQAREAIQAETVTVVADKGYDSRQDIEKCVNNGIVPHVALKYEKEERIYTIDYQEAAISEEERQSSKPENIQKCLAAGVLPTCYENKGISVEVQEESHLSCFVRQDPDTVICPMGYRLTRLKQKGVNTIYASKEACHQCVNRCTASKQHKTVSFAPDTQIVPVRLYGHFRTPPQAIPEGMKANPDNHTLDRSDKPKLKVQLRIRSDSALIKARMCLSEHPFGTVKWTHDARYLLCRGKKKATAELGLSFLVYNMKRALNMVGPGMLIAAMNG